MDKIKKLRLPLVVPVIFTLLFGVFLMVILYLAESGAYLYNPDYIYSLHARSLIQEANRDIQNEYYRITESENDPQVRQEVESLLLERYSQDKSNIAFTIQDQNGTLLLSNCNSEMNYYSRSTMWHSSDRMEVGLRIHFTANDSLSTGRNFYRYLFGQRYGVIVYAVLAFTLAAVTTVLWMRGRIAAKKEKRSTLTRLPLEPLAVFFVVASFLLFLLLRWSSWWIDYSTLWIFVAIVLALGLAEYLLLVWSIYTVCLQRACRTLLSSTLLHRACCWLRRLNPSLPFALVSGGVALVYIPTALYLTWYMLRYTGGLGGLIMLIVLAVTLFAGLVILDLLYNLRILRKASSAVAAGDYSQTINTRSLLGPCRGIAEDLGRMGGGLQTAVQRQMKSERMKTELITNVSHDIKTPLTSILNYVDLLDRLELESEDAQEYIEVLKRQGLRMKKLAEDVVEASRAASGDVTVNLQPLELSELLDQAVAEYAERFDEHSLSCLVNAPPQTVTADGTLLWRVLDNLLGNIYKYALPGTRVYIDVDSTTPLLVTITLRNISATPLNISEDELMERFVRGDEARSENGSGLGLSISRSLTELQGGQFALTVDGDLFKVTITLQAASQPGLS